MDLQSQQKDLEQVFRQFASLNNLTKEQSQELFGKLEGTINLRIINKLLGNLKEEDQALLKEKNFENPEDFVKFLSSRLPNEDFRDLSTSAIEEVLNDFFSKI